MKTPWSLRPREVAALLNPTFCSVLIYEAARGAKQEGNRGLPYTLTFMVLPIILHRPTRQAMPSTIAKRMHAWLEENQQARIGFSNRARNMVPYTREALLFGCAASFLEFTPTACIYPLRRQIRGLNWGTESEAADCRKRARFVGRWLSHAGDEITILGLWGVRP
jgi:hypothetical protein